MLFCCIEQRKLLYLNTICFLSAVKAVALKLERLKGPAFEFRTTITNFRLLYHANTRRQAWGCNGKNFPFEIGWYRQGPFVVRNRR